MLLWTDYMKYRARLRGFELDELEKILRFSPERYSDEATGSKVLVGRHRSSLVLIAIEEQGKDIIPITVHRTSRQQISARVRSGRYTHA